MDKNQATGLLLIFLLLTMYWLYFAPKPVSPEEKLLTDSIPPPSAQDAELKASPVDTANTSLETPVTDLGDFTQLGQGKAEDILLENENIQVVLSSRGGVLKQVTVKGYESYEGENLVLLSEGRSEMEMIFRDKKNRKINLYDLYFTPDKKKLTIAKGDTQSLSFRAEIGEGKSIVQTYTLAGSGYLLDYKVQLGGAKAALDTQQNLNFHWKDRLKRMELDLYYSRYYSTINYTDANEDFSYLKWPSTDEQIAQPEEALNWFSFKQKFFISAMIAPHKNFQKAILIKDTDEGDSSSIKTMDAHLQIPMQDVLGDKGNFQFYFGPNRYQELRQLDIAEFHQNVYLGWSFISLFARYLIIPVFNYLEQGLSNYGIIIILMVLIIKTLLLPLTYRSYKSMAKMKVLNDLLKPELDAFKEKNKITGTMLSTEDQQKVQQEQMRLYGEMGTSPFAAMSGCIPMLLQMPILFAMFMFFPNAIELRQEGFLWAQDLSRYDSILNLPFAIPAYGSHVSLFTLLMTLSTIAVTYFNTQTQSSAAMQGPMKYMGYFLPVIFMFVLNSYPSGLSLYYLMQNVVSIGQQSFFKKFMINEDKIKQQFQDYKKNQKGKESKKSSFMQRLEEAQKKAVEKAETQKQAKAQKKANSGGQNSRKTSKKKRRS